MSERETELRLERELREVLRGREPGPAPYGLRGRVNRVPDEVPVQARRSVAHAAGALAGVAAVVAIAVGIVALGAQRGFDSAGPVAGPGSSTVPLLPGINPADGLVPHPPIGDLALALAILAGGLLALALGLFVLRRKRAGVLALLAGLLVPGAMIALAKVPGATGDERFGSYTSPISPVEMPPGYDGERLLYLAAGSGTTFETSFAVVNSGLLPITVHGIEAVPGGSTGPKWVAVNLVPDWVTPQPGMITHIDVVPFAPFTLAAGEARQLLLIGTPGACAAGAAFDPADAASLDYRPVPIRVVYDILGWPRSDPITLSYRLLVPVPPACANAESLLPGLSRRG